MNRHSNLSRRRFLSMGAGLAAASGSRAADGDRILALHQASGVFEGYTKPLLKFTPAGIEPGSFVEHVATIQAGLWKLREGGVRMANMSVGVPHCRLPPKEGVEPEQGPICSLEEQPRLVLRQLDALYESAKRCPEALGIARNVAEAERLNADGKLALFLHLTGAWIADDLAVLRSYGHMGVTCIHPCIEGHHAIGDPANEPAVHGGLTPLGREVVREMNRIGMVVDVAHGSDDSIRQMVELSTEPVIYSHGACRALCDNPRNLTDERIRAIADKGGVVGIAFVSAMLSDEARQKGGRADPHYREVYAQAEADLRAKCADPYEYMERRADGTFMPEVFRRLGWPSGGLASVPANRANVVRVVDHISHVAKLVGVDHVGIGTDYESGDVPNGLEDARKLPNLTAALVRRGFSDEEIGKILAGNFRRVYRRVLDHA